MGNRGPVDHSPVSVVDAERGRRKATRTGWRNDGCTPASRGSAVSAGCDAKKTQHEAVANAQRTSPFYYEAHPIGPSSRASTMRRRAAQRSPRQPPARRLLARPFPLWRTSRGCPWDPTGLARQTAHETGSGQPEGEAAAWREARSEGDCDRCGKKAPPVC
jgi:hypothetical protein